MLVIVHLFAYNVQPVPAVADQALSSLALFLHFQIKLGVFELKVNTRSINKHPSVNPLMTEPP